MAAQAKKLQAVTSELICMLLSVMVECNGFTMASGTKLVGTACLADADCQSGFCDLGTCQEIKGQYGMLCFVAPKIAEGYRDGKLNMCGTYICEDQRCRSCHSDEQCQQEYGVKYCRSHTFRPGRRCGS